MPAMIDIFVSPSGIFNIITLDHMKQIKNTAIVGDISFSACLGLEGLEYVKIEKIMPQLDRSGVRSGILSLWMPSRERG